MLTILNLIFKGVNKMIDNYDYGTCEECGRKLTEETTRECKYCSKLLCEWCINVETCEECKHIPD